MFDRQPTSDRLDNCPHRVPVHREVIWNIRPTHVPTDMLTRWLLTVPLPPLRRQVPTRRSSSSIDGWQGISHWQMWCSSQTRTSQRQTDVRPLAVHDQARLSSVLSPNPQCQ
jgi:hypothetical protein